MSFYSGMQFFMVLLFVVLGALLIGVLEKNLKWYSLFFSGVITICILAKSKEQLCYFIAYYLLELALVKGYEKLRKSKGRITWLYRLTVFLTITPLILCKLCDLKVFEAMSWFQFVGISYLTFRVVQIVKELYDGVIETVSVSDFTAFLVFFPTFSCGPIDRSRRFCEDLHTTYKREEYLELFGTGLWKLMLGILYKFVIAELWYQLLNMIPNDALPFGQKVLAMIGYAYCYGFYMFFDFAGYSLMAIGTGYMLGIRVPENFKRPFVSTDMKDFWARWHISLSEWFRDFVFSRFIMLSMKKKWFRTRLTGASIGFLVNMLVMGLWHGLTLHYILYGLYHGILLAGTEIYQKKSKFYKKYKKTGWYQFISWFLTLQLVMFGFLIFSGHLIQN